MQPNLAGGINNKQEESNETNKVKFTNMIGARFSALAPLPVENLYAGLSVGVGRYTEKNTFDNHSGIQENFDESGIYVNAMARVKYKAKQIAIADRVYPFACQAHQGRRWRTATLRPGRRKGQGRTVCSSRQGSRDGSAVSSTEQ